MLELFKYTDSEQKELLKSMTILIDTREKEKKNTHITDYLDTKNISWIRKALPYGDYSVMIPKNEKLNIPRDLVFTNQICIERKASLSEWASNLVNDRSAVKKKFALSPPHKILMIENGSYEDMVNGNYYGNYSSKSYLATFHSMWHEFDIPIIFMPNPEYSGMFIAGYLWYYIRNIIK